MAQDKKNRIAIGCLMAAMLVFFASTTVAYFVWRSQANADTKQTTDIVDVARRTNIAAKSLTVLVQSIQDERVRNVRNACEEQNARHDNTIQTLDILLLERLTGVDVPANTTHPEILRQLRMAFRSAGAEGTRLANSRIGTLLIIDAMAPKQNCDRRVATQTGQSTKTP